MGSQQQPWTFAEDRFGRRLKHEREKRGMTQADVANVLEVEHGLRLHPTAIAKMEQRDVDKPRAIRLYEARAIADLFGLTTDEMMSTGNAELEALSREFTKLGSQAEALRARTDDLFGRLRGMLSIMSVPPDQVSPELQEYRNRIIRALAEMHKTDEARRLKAEALLDDVTADTPLARDEAAAYAATTVAAAAHAGVARFMEDHPAQYHTREEAFRALGEKLLNARKQSDASLFDVQQTSRIRPDVLVKIETGEFDRIGDEPLVLGGLRSYADIVGLNPKEVLIEYLVAQNLPEESA